MAEEEEFRCRAINDYYASVTDELDLKEGSEYTIMQTSPSGWWYAINDDGEDGWVPSNYLVRLDDEEAGGGGGGGGAGAGAGGGSAEEEEPAYDDEDGKEEAPKYSEADSGAGGAGGGGGDAGGPGSEAPGGGGASAASAQPAKKTTTVITVDHFNSGVDDGAPEKPITEWDVDDTLGYLQHSSSLSARNDFKLTQACRYLTQLATKGDKAEEICAKGGLDIVFKVMQATIGDVAIQMSCCAAAVVLCANPASKQYPASVNGIYHISQGIKDNMSYRPFVILAFNAVCNFCHNHPRHRSMALETDIVSTVISAMKFHCGKEEGFRVHSAGCLALRNVAADPKGQGAVGPEGVTVIVNGFEEYRTIKEVVEGSMGVLCNLCALASNGEAFVMQGGLQLLDNLYMDPDSADNIRLAAASVLHNLAANQDTALLLSADQGIDLIVKILKKTDVDTVLFLNTLKVLAALLFKLPEDSRAGGNKKSEVMTRILSRGIVASFNEAVQFDNKELQEMVATLLVVIAQTNSKLAQALADADAPAHMIPVCMNDPTPQTLHCSLAIFFHICDAFQNQRSLVEAGIFNLLTSDWYKKETVKEDTVRISCGVFIKFFSNVSNAKMIHEYDAGIKEFVAYNRENRPNLSDLCNAIEGALKQLDPMAGSMHVQESYTEVSHKQASRAGGADEASQQPSGGSGDPAEEKEIEQPQPRKYKQTRETKAIKRESRMGSDAHPVQAQQVEAQAVPATAKSHPSGANPGGIEVERYYTYDELKSGKKVVSGDNREAYLSDEDFQDVFKMDKEAFYKLRPWKQKQLKKSKGLW